MSPEDQDGALTWKTFTAYMDRFLERLDERFSGREACKLRHEALDARLLRIDGPDGRLKQGDDQFKAVDKRLGTVEKRIYAALAVLAAFQFALQQGWLRF